MTNATDDRTLQTLIMDNSDLFIESGFTSALASVTTREIDRMVKTVALQHVLLQTKAEIDQFCAGLKALGVLASMQENPHLFNDYFCLDGIKHMTAGI